MLTEIQHIQSISPLTDLASYISPSMHTRLTASPEALILPETGAINPHTQAGCSTTLPSPRVSLSPSIAMPSPERNTERRTLESFEPQTCQKRFQSYGVR